MKSSREKVSPEMQPSWLRADLDRRKFLTYTGAVALVGTMLATTGCKDDDPEPDPNAVDLGTGDTGILNYAYALEQLEYAFYAEVVANASFNTNFSTDERNILNDLRAHELVHREFFKTALGSAAIPSLEVDFSTINFSSRTSVLETAKAFEDLGVSAYNGAGKLLVSADLLLVAGKIVSVEARHAAAIRDLISPKSASFAGDDVVTVANGFDGAKTPNEVLAIAGTYISTPINASNLPTS